MRTKSWRAISPLTALAVAGLVALPGCGNQSDAGDAGADSSALTDRARQVAAAWDGSNAADAWREGYHPMGAVVQPPRGGWHTTADEQAYRDRSFVLRAVLPHGPKTGPVTWANRRSLDRPLEPGAEAYGALSGGRVGGHPHLTVTKTEPAEMTVATSRGPATVPAWEFTLDGYASPLKRAAAVASELPEPPIRATRELPGQPLKLTGTADDGRSVTVTVLRGVCDKRSALDVVETQGSVVLSYASTRRHSRELCTKQAKLQQVTARLDQPIGDRTLLDAMTGRPIAYKPDFGSSPSWS